MQALSFATRESFSSRISMAQRTRPLIRRPRFPPAQHLPRHPHRGLQRGQEGRGKLAWHARGAPVHRRARGPPALRVPLLRLVLRVRRPAGGGARGAAARRPQVRQPRHAGLLRGRAGKLHAGAPPPDPRAAPRSYFRGEACLLHISWPMLRGRLCKEGSTFSAANRLHPPPSLRQPPAATAAGCPAFVAPPRRLLA